MPGASASREISGSSEELALRIGELNKGPVSFVFEASHQSLRDFAGTALLSLPSEAKLTIHTEFEKEGQWVATIPAGQDPKTF